MMLITLYVMGTTLGSFEDFCKAVNDFEKDEVEKAFDALEAESMEDLLCVVDKLLGEMNEASRELYVYWEEKQNSSKGG